MQGLAGCWTLELYNITFGVGEVDGGAFSFGSVAHLNRANLNAERLEVAANIGLVEWFHPQTEVIEISRLPSGCGATGSAESGTSSRIEYCTGLVVAPVFSDQGGGVLVRGSF